MTTSKLLLIRMEWKSGKEKIVDEDGSMIHERQLVV